MKYLLDVSSIVYGGHYMRDRRCNGFPVAGISKLLGIINANFANHDIALCFDGESIIKKELLPEYKAGRVPNYAVYAQISLLKEILLDCNIPFYQDDKYEADDYIYSLCHSLGMICCPDNVTIYSDDRDIACCVTPTVSLAGITSNGKCIDMDSYSDRVVRGSVIPYNTILIWKMFHGDSSDNYKGVRIPGLNFDIVSAWWKSTLDPHIEAGQCVYSAYASYDVFASMIRDHFTDVSPEAMDELLRQARIAFPYCIDITNRPLEEHVADIATGTPRYSAERKTFKFFGKDDIDYSRFKMYCDVLGVNNFRRSRGLDTDSPAAKEFYELLSLRAQELSNGDFVTQHVSGKQVKRETPAIVMNMELPL